MSAVQVRRGTPAHASMMSSQLHHPHYQLRAPASRRHATATVASTAKSSPATTTTTTTGATRRSISTLEDEERILEGMERLRLDKRPATCMTTTTMPMTTTSAQRSIVNMPATTSSPAGRPKANTVHFDDAGYIFSEDDDLNGNDEGTAAATDPRNADNSADMLVAILEQVHMSDPPLRLQDAGASFMPYIS